jgi:hypothetical protein
MVSSKVVELTGSPPGVTIVAGDAQISIGQQLAVSGAVIVTTPQVGAWFPLAG